MAGGNSGSGGCRSSCLMTQHWKNSAGGWLGAKGCGVAVIRVGLTDRHA